MSATVVYGVKSDGAIQYIGEARNAFRGAMYVWSILCEKYQIDGGMFGGFQKLWKLADTSILEDFENIAMKSTFDNVIVRKEDIPLLLQSYKEFDSHFSNSNLLEQVEIIQNEIMNNQDMIAVCWNQTSVNRNPWSIGYDEELEEEIPYNIFSGKKHWFINE